MRRSASEVISDLETRVARLERQAIMHPSMLNRDIFFEEKNTPKNKAKILEKQALKKIERQLLRAGYEVAVHEDYDSLELKDFKALTIFGAKSDTMRRAYQTDTGFSLPRLRLFYENGVELSFGLGTGRGAFRNGLELFIWQ